MSELSAEFESYKKLLNATPCGIGLFDIKTSAPVFLNSAYYKLIGYTEEEYRAHMMDNDYLMFPQDLPISHQGNDDFVQSGEAHDFEYRIVRKDGGIRWIKLNISSVNFDGETYAYATFADITKEKEAYNQLKMISENTDDSISLIKVSNGNEQFIYANDRFFSLIGIDKEAYLKDMHAYDVSLVSNEDLERIAKMVKRAYISCSVQEIEHRLIRPDGKIIWVNRRCHIVPQDEKNTFIIVSVVTDITEQKSAQMQQQHERERSMNILEELNAAVMEWDIVKNTFYASDSFKRFALSDVNVEDLLNNRGPLSMVHTDDQQELRKFDDAIADGKDQTDVVLRLKMKNGSYHWCRMIAFFYRDDEGAPIRTVGVIVDINEEHEKSFMLNNLLNALPGGIAIFRAADTLECQYFSDGFAALSGRTREEVEAMFADTELLKQGIVPEYYKEFLENLKMNADAVKPVNYVYRFISADGQIDWLQVTASKIREDRGCPVYYCIYTKPTDEAALYRSIVEDSAVGVFIADRATRTALYANQLFCAIAGFGPKSISGQAVQRILEEYNKKELLSAEQIAALDYDHYTEFHETRHDGRYLAIKAKAVIWNDTDSYILYITDETAEHQRDLELQKIIDEVPAGIGIYEIIGTRLDLVYMNDAYNHIVDMTRAEVEQYLGEGKALDGVHSEDRSIVEAHIAALIAGDDHNSFVVRIRNGHEGWTWFQLSISVVERTSERIKLYVAFTNCDEMVSAQKSMETMILQEKTLLDSIPGGIAKYRLKKDGRVLIDYVSDGFARLTGYSVEECLALEDLNCKIHPQDLPMLQGTVAKALESHDPINIIYRILRKDGSVITTRFNANVMLQEELAEDDIGILYAVQTVVSDETIKTLHEQEYYRQVLGMLGIAYWEWSKEGGYYASENYFKYALSKAPQDDMRDSHVYDGIVHPDDVPLLMQFLARGETKDTNCSTIMRMAMTDGSYQWTEVLGFRRYDADGNPIHISATLRSMNEEWMLQKKALEEALAQATAANEAKTAFLSRVSHDMRTPLNGILGLTGFLKENVNNQQAAKDIEQLEISGKYLLNLINDTLDVSRIENGKLELNPSPCDGRMLLTNVMALAKPGMDEKHIQFDTNIADLPFTILYVDVGRVQQIVINIIGNAVKFTPAYGTITLSLRNIGMENGVITDEIKICDTGIGMSADYLPHIFEPFSQADSSKTNERQGTGLGMAITKQLVELMGGTISVESELGKGTCFTVTIKMNIANEEQVSEWKETNKHKEDRAALKGKKILLCEDNHLNAMIIKRLLESVGVTMDHAENGQAGLNVFLKSNDGYYDAILMDVRMPKMDGIETTKAIRAQNREDAHIIPIIAVSANALDQDVKAVLQAGMNAHVSKPIEPNIFFGTLNTEINSSH